jgi:hypothetical protein
MCQPSLSYTQRNCLQEAFVSQEMGAHGSFGPETDSIRQGGDGSGVSCRSAGVPHQMIGEIRDIPLMKQPPKKTRSRPYFAAFMYLHNQCSRQMTRTGSKDSRYMTDIITDCIKQTSGNIGLLEHLCTLCPGSRLAEDFAESRSDSGGFETNLASVCTVDITD